MGLEAPLGSKPRDGARRRGAASRAGCCLLLLSVLLALRQWGGEQTFVPNGLGVHPQNLHKSWPHGGTLHQVATKPQLLHRRPAQQIFARLWKGAERFNFGFCSLIGARFVFSQHVVTACTAPAATFGLAAASAFLTTFGGGTQSRLLLWAASRMRSGSEEPLPKFAWQQAEPHLWALVGLGLATGAYITDTLHLLTPAVKYGIALNLGIVSGLAVIDSGWLQKEAREPERRSVAKGLPVAKGLLSMLGVFLYACGGGFIRDLLSSKVPSALAVGNLLPLLLGTGLCLALHEHADKRHPAGTYVLAAGIPATACLCSYFV